MERINQSYLSQRLYLVPLALSGLLAVFAVLAQPDGSLLKGFWERRC